MTHRFLKWTQFFSLFILLCLSSGCEPKEAGTEKEVLLRVGDRVLTVLEFNKAFEIAETAYPHNIRQQPEELRKAKARLLNELIDEMVCLQRAEELEITVADAELQKVVSGIKSDYPEGEFEKTLLEAAVTYDSWESRLKTRLIMEKVIEQDLENPLTLAPADIADYYKENYRGEEMNPYSGGASHEISEVIVNQLRREKAEEAYLAWMKDLKNKYRIEINSEQWEKISGFKTGLENETPHADLESD